VGVATSCKDRPSNASRRQFFRRSARRHRFITHEAGHKSISMRSDLVKLSGRPRARRTISRQGHHILTAAGHLDQMAHRGECALSENAHPGVHRPTPSEARGHTTSPMTPRAVPILNDMLRVPSRDLRSRHFHERRWIYGARTSIRGANPIVSHARHSAAESRPRIRAHPFT